MSFLGLGQSKLDRGLEAFNAKGWKRARKLLEEAMEEHETAEGGYHLGLIYWRGLGGPADKRAAAECFALAADHGHAAALTAYGVALRTGVGVHKDSEAARAAFREAVNRNDTEAMVQLASISEPDEARRLLARAAERGHVKAMRHLADLLMRRDPVEALSWLCAAAGLVGDDAARKRAAALARELEAREIEAAQRAGRIYAKNIREARGNT